MLSYVVVPEPATMALLEGRIGRSTTLPQQGDGRRPSMDGRRVGLRLFCDVTDGLGRPHNPPRERRFSGLAHKRERLGDPGEEFGPRDAGGVVGTCCSSAYVRRLPDTSPRRKPGDCGRFATAAASPELTMLRSRSGARAAAEHLLRGQAAHHHPREHTRTPQVTRRVHVAKAAI